MPTSPVIEACRGVARLSTEQTAVLASAMAAGTHATHLLATAPPSTSQTLTADLQQVIADGQAARAIFIESNLGLVITMARKYAGRGGVSMADLVQEGTIGLTKAVDRYDPTKGAAFSTYAAWWIRQALLAALNNARMVRRPAHVEDAIRKMHAVTAALAAELGREPTVEEVAARSKIPARLIERYQRADQAEVSLDALAAGQAGTALADTLPSEDAAAVLHQVECDADLSVLRAALGPMVERLSRTERDVLALRFGLDGNPPKTLEAAAEALGLTRIEVRRTEAVAIARLRSQNTRDLIAAARTAA